MGGSGVAGNVGTASTVHRYRISLVEARPSDVAGVGQGCSVRGHARDEGVPAATVEGQVGADGDREAVFLGIGVSRDVGPSSGVDRDTSAEFKSSAPDIARVFQSAARAGDLRNEGVLSSAVKCQVRALGRQESLFV